MIFEGQLEPKYYSHDTSRPETSGNVGVDIINIWINWPTPVASLCVQLRHRDNERCLHLRGEIKPQHPEYRFTNPKSETVLSESVPGDTIVHRFSCFQGLALSCVKRLLSTQISVIPRVPLLYNVPA